MQAFNRFGFSEVIAAPYNHALQLSLVVMRRNRTGGVVLSTESHPG